MTRGCVRIGLIGLLCASAVAFTAVPPAVAAPPPDDPPPATLPSELPPPDPGMVPDMVIPVPVGCPVPEPAAAVFTGTMIGKDDITQTVRFRIDQLRAGSTDPWAVNGLIDVRYGPDYRFLDEGEQYLIGVGLDPVYGVLGSSVRPAEPNFGGNDVVGVDDLAVDCPTLDDPVRTLQVDGTSVDSGVLSLMTEDRRLLLATLAVPAAIVFAVLLGLVVLRVFGGLAFQGIFQLGRAAVTPVPDHRAVRVRTHRPRDEGPDVEEPSQDDADVAAGSADADDESTVVH